MKKVLIITYYWPPSGGAGVQRWLKFVKYLREFGWEPIVYTPENPDFAIQDSSLLKDIPPDIQVLKVPIWEPYEIYKILIGKKGQKVNVSFAEGGAKKSFVHKVAFSLRGNLLIPDPKRFWKRASVKFLRKFINSNPIDAIVSTGPPHSMHIIAKKLHRITEVPWLADFRDPWTNIDFYKELNLTIFADRLHHKMEKQVLTEATKVVSVTPTWCKELELIADRPVDLVHNGFDEQDVVPMNLPIDKEFSISHIGSINKDRNPTVFWQALSQLVKAKPEIGNCLKIKLVGNVEEVVFSEIEKNGLSKYVVEVGYLSHQEAVKFQQTSQILLLLINNTPNSSGILTGKLYEYIASRRPVLAIGPVESDIADLLQETNSGKIVGFDDLIGMKKVLLDYFENYKNGNLISEAKDYEKYSRKSQCEVIAGLLDNMVK